MKKPTIDLKAGRPYLEALKVAKRSIIFASLSLSLIPPLQAETLQDILHESGPMLKIASAESYLDNPNISREDKIQKFWKEYSTSKDDTPNSGPTTKELALEGLSFLSPTELIPDFINRFNTVPQDQENCLDLIIAGLDRKPQYFTPEDIKKVVIAQNFLNEQIQTQNNPDLLSTVIYAYNNNTPYSTEKAKLVNDAINRLASLKKVDPQSLYQNKFDLDINDPSGNSLNQLIGSMENSKYKDDFSQYVVSTIGTGLTAKMVSKPNQNEISAFLLKLTNQSIASYEALSKTMTPNDMMRMRGFPLSAQIYFQIRAYGLFLNKPDHLANTILAIQNPYLQADLVSQALSDTRDVVTRKILKVHKDELIAHLKKSIKPNDVRPTDTLSLSSDPSHPNPQDKANIDALISRMKIYNNSDHATSEAIQPALNMLNKL